MLIICQPNWKKKIMPGVLQMLVISCLPVPLIFSLFFLTYSYGIYRRQLCINTHLWNEQVQDTLIWTLNNQSAFSSATESAEYTNWESSLIIFFFTKYQEIPLVNSRQISVEEKLSISLT